MITALITNKKSPIVTIVAGNVIKTKIGFKNILSNPITTATHKADVHPAISTPGNSQHKNMTIAVVINNLKINPIIYVY
jgi:hypothetical protein